MGIKTIVFDFGNVVGFFDHRLTSNRLAAHSEMGADKIHAFLFNGPIEDDYESGRISTSAFLAQVRQTCQLVCSDQVIATAWADIFWPNPDVCALMPALKPYYRLLLGSNTNELHARQFGQQFAAVFKYFDALMLSHLIGARKPSEQFFKHCLLQAGCEAEECLFIDDLPVNVAGARACGWQGIVYSNIADLRKQLHALEIRGLEQDALS